MRQARLNELSSKRIYDEDTVLPAVPLWFQTMTDERAQSEIDHLGSGQMMTDWGARIISNQSRLYDPLSYHYGSVWPLFTRVGQHGRLPLRSPARRLSSINGERLAHLYERTRIRDGVTVRVTLTRLLAAHLIIKSGRRLWSLRPRCVDCSE